MGPGQVLVVALKAAQLDGGVKGSRLRLGGGWQLGQLHEQPAEAE